MPDALRIALYGATGALGRQLAAALERSSLEVEELIAVGGGRSLSEVRYKGRILSLTLPSDVPTGDLDVAFLAVPGDAAEPLRRELMDEGILVVDLSASGRRDPELPLVWPELAESGLKGHPGGFSVPCSVVGTLAPVLAALDGLGRVAEIDVVALLGATAAGLRGETALSSQTFALLNFRVPDDGPFDGVLAFNALPGHPAGEGDELALELPRLMPRFLDAGLRSSFVQVPTFTGIGAWTTLRFEGEAPSFDDLRIALDTSERVVRTDTGPAIRDTIDVDQVFVGQLARDPDGVVRFFAAADVLHRTANAAIASLERVHEGGLW